MNEARVLASIEKSEHAEIRVTLQTYFGRPVVDCRVWYQPPGDAEYVRTRRGFTFDARKLRALLEQLEAAELPAFPSQAATTTKHEENVECVQAQRSG